MPITGALELKAAIFDMDGLLIDSESLWREAEIGVFRSVGVTLTDEMCRQTTGMRLDEVVRFWHARSPWQRESLQSVEARILDAVGRLIVERSKPMPGVGQTISTFIAHDYRLAVASSSPTPLIRTVLEKFRIIDFFSVLQSAEAEDEGKPNPAVYLSAISRLDADPADCVAFEDSVSGVRAAKSAGARVIAVPDPADANNPAFATADLILSSLRDFTMEHLQLLRLESEDAIE